MPAAATTTEIQLNPEVEQTLEAGLASVGEALLAAARLNPQQFKLAQRYLNEGIDSHLMKIVHKVAAERKG